MRARNNADSYQFDSKGARLRVRDGRLGLLESLRGWKTGAGS
jgi:hypothetical protein